MRLPARELQEALGAVLPDDHARQVLADSYIEAALGRLEGPPWRVLDLGCGTGKSIDYFRARDPAVEWTGLDLKASPEVNARTRSDGTFATFDGVTMPFADESFDLVYCKQVLEHVRHPAPLLAEARRVLRAGGSFAGSTSQLEPYHSLSVWNYTPVGLRELLLEAGLTLTELRPGIDALTLIARRLVGPRKSFDRWWGGSSPLNSALDLYARARRLDARTLNATKLLFCGQFAFVAEPR